MFASITKVSALAHVAVLCSLISFVVAAPIGSPLQTIPEYASLPSVPSSPPISPQINTVANKAPWWRQWNFPWSANRGITSERQLRNVLRNGPSQAVSDAKPYAPVKTVFAKTFQAVKLPGTVYDGQIIDAMRQKGYPIYAAGQNGQMWYIRADGVVRRIQGNEQGAVLRYLEAAEPTSGRVEYLSLPEKSVLNAAAAETKSGASWWSRISEGTRGFLGRVTPNFTSGVKYLRGP